MNFDRISRHFRSICNFCFSFSQNGCRWPFWITENHFRSHFSPFQMNKSTFILFGFCSQNGCRRPFWLPKNPFRLHFSPFLIFFFTKWLPAAILDYRKSPSITFLAISNQYTTFICFDFSKFWQFFSAILESPICAKSNRVLPLCVINGYAKYEVDR